MRSATRPLADLGEGWRSVTRASRRRVAVAVLAGTLVLALLGARHGTPRARAAATVTILASAALLLGWRRLVRARLGDPRRVLKALVGPVDPEGCERALRALTLRAAGPSPPRDGTSEALARLHVGRSLARLPVRRILDRSARTAARVGTGAALAIACAAAIAAVRGLSVLEGADVLVARHGVAPVAMSWIDGPEVVARPPDYLHLSEIDGFGPGPLVVPYGATLTVRGVPVHPGRALRLSDGATEEAFVDDGAGAVVARWKVERSGRLRAVARFGDVIIPESRDLDVVSIADEAPIVHLDGAPRQLRLVDTVEDIPIRYDASDDHGLREIHLVLRSGLREERRILARLDGETKTFAGGSVLKLRDAFLAKSHAPVAIDVEARDNDPLSGPKWGASETITVIPPDVGEPEALRLEALRRWRDALVDTLAWRLASEQEVPDHDSPRDAASKRRAIAAESEKRADDDAQLLARTLSQVYAGVRIAPRIRSLLFAQQRATRKAVDAEARAPSEGSHAAAVKATERFVLVTDAVVRGLGERDGRASARELADVADDLAEGADATQSGASDSRARAEARMDAAGAVLSTGGAAMRRLGALGRDLGEIVGADLMRVQRARRARDFAHAELAARDLAARLRQPDPSFDAKGAAARGGGEAGGAQGTPGDDSEPPDEVEEAFDEAAQDLERLAQDHAGEIEKVERILAGARDDDDDDQTSPSRNEARRHARAVRAAADPLPAVGTGSDSWTSKGAAGRELAQQMARALEEGRDDEAVDSGRSAVGSLEEAGRMLQRGGWFDDPGGEHQREVDRARRKLEDETRWAEAQRNELHRRAAERARAGLQQGGEDEERLADRARSLAQRGRDQDIFPEQAAQAVDDAERAAHEAADALKSGDADRGRDKQREAQRALEAAQEQLQGDDDAAGSAGDEGGRLASRDPVAIPDANEHKGPEEFRRRVMHGLAQPGSPLLKDAVKRYAEGLLR